MTRRSGFSAPGNPFLRVLPACIGRRHSEEGSEEETLCPSSVALSGVSSSFAGSLSRVCISRGCSEEVPEEETHVHLRLPHQVLHPLLQARQLAWAALRVARRQGDYVFTMSGAALDDGN